MARAASLPVAQAQLGPGPLQTAYSRAAICWCPATLVVREYSRPALQAPARPGQKYSRWAAQLALASMQAQGLAPSRLWLAAPRRPAAKLVLEHSSPAPAADRRWIAAVPRSAPHRPAAQAMAEAWMQPLAWAADSTFRSHRPKRRSHQSRAQRQKPRRSLGCFPIPPQAYQFRAHHSSSSPSPVYFLLLEYARSVSRLPMEQRKAELRQLIVTTLANEFSESD